MSMNLRQALAVAVLALAPPAAATELSIAEQIDAIVAPYVEARDFMGVVGVHRDGEEALLLPYGLASVELDVPHQEDGVFMIGSVSKQFTAAAVLALEEAGALSTADSVAKHLPDFAHGATTTIEQLLTHTSGIADIYSLERFGASGGRVGTFEEVLDDLGKTSLTFGPGSGYAYSNGAYAVLAAVIEKASGVGYGEYLSRRFFEPLEMSDTAHDGPSAAVASRVPGYDPWGADGLSPAIPVSAAFTTGSGSLWSSAEDLARWSAALHGGKVLRRASYEKLTRDYGNGYGYGVSVFQRFGRDVIGHDGRVAGYSSDLARYVDEKTTIVVLGNVQSVARDEIRRLVAAAVFGEDYEIPAPRAYAGKQDVPLEELTGVYSFGPGFDVSITESDGRLLARANQGGYSELVPLDEGAWFSRLLYATVRFGRDAEGSVDRLIWGGQEGAPAGRRVEVDAAPRAELFAVGLRERLASRLLDEERELLIYLPESYASGQLAYPVLYLLDAESDFLHTIGVVEFLAGIDRIPEMIVVGVVNTHRSRDLTPESGDQEETAFWSAVGGADRFRRALREEVIPFVDARYRTEPYRIVRGSSFGGLFAIHDYTRADPVFDAVIASSPAVGWNFGRLLQAAPDYFSRGAPRPLYVASAGGDFPGNLDSILEFTGIVEATSRPDLFRHEHLEQEGHYSLHHRSTYRGLEFLYDSWPVPAPVADSADFDAYQRHFAGLSERFGYTIQVPMQSIVRIGNQLLRRQEFAKGISVFERALDLYPDRPEAHWRLGEAHRLAGRSAEARAHFEQAYALALAQNAADLADYAETLESLESLEEP